MPLCDLNCKFSLGLTRSSKKKKLFWRILLSLSVFSFQCVDFSDRKETTKPVRMLAYVTLYSLHAYKLPGGHSLIWPIRGCAAGQGMVFGLLCPEQGIQFYANLS